MRRSIVIASSPNIVLAVPVFCAVSLNLLSGCGLERDGGRSLGRFICERRGDLFYAQDRSSLELGRRKTQIPINNSPAFLPHGTSAALSEATFGRSKTNVSPG
jgi:hypothetical protein